MKIIALLVLISTQAMAWDLFTLTKSNARYAAQAFVKKHYPTEVPPGQQFIFGEAYLTPDSPPVVKQHWALTRWQVPMFLNTPEKTLLRIYPVQCRLNHIQTSRYGWGWNTGCQVK